MSHLIFFFEYFFYKWHFLFSGALTFATREFDATVITDHFLNHVNTLSPVTPSEGPYRGYPDVYRGGHSPAPVAHPSWNLPRVYLHSRIANLDAAGTYLSHLLYSRCGC